MAQMAAVNERDPLDGQGQSLWGCGSLNAEIKQVIPHSQPLIQNFTEEQGNCRSSGCLAQRAPHSDP